MVGQVLRWPVGEADLHRRERRACGLAGKANDEAHCKLRPLSFGQSAPVHRESVTHGCDDRQQAVTHRVTVADELLDGGIERRTRTERVFEEVQRTSRDRLCHVQAEGFVASHLLSQAPSFNRRAIRNPRIRVIQVSSTKAGK